MAKSKIKQKTTQEVLGVASRRRKQKKFETQKPTRQRVVVIGADGKKRQEWR